MKEFYLHHYHYHHTGTSAVDPHTDKLIQKVLKETAMKYGTTVLTIAHRLDTIIDFDRILVLGIV